MHSRRLLLPFAVVMLAGTFVALIQGPAGAETPAVTYTTIVVTDMHCATCAKKIAAKLYVLPGVKEIRADVPANTAFVVPQTGKRVSPRAMWQAVESAGFKTVRLAGPSGDFTSLPPE
jgi:copper chaperone CopZ